MSSFPFSAHLACVASVISGRCLLPVLRAAIIILPIAVMPGCASSQLARTSETNGGSPMQRLLEHSANDYRRHYQANNVADLLLPLAVAGTLANTNADTWIRDKWQDDARSDASNDLALVFLRVGDAGQNRISMPIYSITMLAADYSGIPEHDNRVATWAERSFRANVLGGPQAWAMTYLLGSHRPRAGNSGWNPWNDNDGVSGHSFYGAVPLLTAARMSESAGWRNTLYGLSLLPAYARVNDNQHYTSQAVMGWSLAWLATRTVAQGDGDNDPAITFSPMLLPDGGYIGLSWRF